MQQISQPTSEKICPLRNKLCKGTDCAWFVSGKDKCAVWLISNLTNVKSK